jgi:hypothetical protein
MPFKYGHKAKRLLVSTGGRFIGCSGSASLARTQGPARQNQFSTILRVFGSVGAVAPLHRDQATLVRAARHSGHARILRRLCVGVVKSLELEVEDASPTSAALLTLQQWADQVAAREAERAHTRYDRSSAPRRRYTKGLRVAVE